MLQKFRLRFIRSTNADEKMGLAFILDRKKTCLRIKMSALDFALALMAGKTINCTVEKLEVKGKNVKVPYK